MNPRSTAILFLVAATLGAFVYFYEIGGEAGRKEAEAAQKRLFAGVDSEKIDWISLRTTDGQAARLERHDGAWRIREPLDFPADRFAADGLASALAQFSSETVIEEPRPSDVYGLDASEPTVRFSAGGVEHTLFAGDKTPVGANHYASVGGKPDVYTVASHRVEGLEKAFDDLREKRIAHFEASAVDRLTASWPDGRVVVERGEGGWTLVAPITGPADSQTVEALLSDLSFLRADGFVDEPTAEMAADFRPAWFEVELALLADAEGGEAKTVRLSFGGSVDEDQRLVRGSETSLYRVAGSRTAELPRRLSDYRFRQLARFVANDAERIEFGFAASGESFAVTATKENDTWTASPDPIESEALVALVSELADLRAETILADAMGAAELQALGLDPPNATISIYGASGESEALAEIRLGTVTSDGIPARIPGQETVYQLDGALAEHLPVSLEAYRNRFVQAEDEEPADAVAVPVEGATPPE